MCCGLVLLGEGGKQCSPGGILPALPGHSGDHFGHCLEFNALGALTETLLLKVGQNDVPEGKKGLGMGEPRPGNARWEQ